ncbi:UDP-N-acetylmuramoyl-tripeptide--D-alanyl-D-alanine ligase [Cricetibacter osteomyelitidis]|uniref:UDP-N-acetylmuramoyl-tripeptide--D-alanyl-D-alanine ligase n=1 Tax=Cricetibacter osteomyelitidis TaxID=1521931 RepID=A0A4R2T2G7_9PAST|nr:UDP-N-acetylmuramoyl-tripeptide--D-alanyl-D-alanine ligase [Cricetibacter osteomyelitidis]TCP95004.1 UDP-N-acetylmuramoyl-tripeptide--D-alanyl-D-alanine ligase [Cricetibacter osteomyelitidis]
MITLNTIQLAEILNAQLIGGNVNVSTISTDTRKSCENGLFFALKGENFDAHQYLDKAVEQGATGLVVEQVNPAIDRTQLVVADTRLALGVLAKWLKSHIKPKTVAITGSSGKTTVKEMTASILNHTAKNENAVLFTQGNFNNDIGVPLTLLRLTPEHRFAVVELGANHQGEIDYTTHLVQPDVALVNNIAAAHLEGFGSIEGVAKAKGEIYRGLSHQGVAIINLDCNGLPNWQTEIGEHQVRSFSATNLSADYHAENLTVTATGSSFILCTPKGQIAVNLPYLGKHNVSNALAASALAMNVGASLQDVKAGLEQRSQVKGRLFPIQVRENLLLLDDTYNANVDSLQSAINVLSKYTAFRILVVGDMAELGENSQGCHQQVADFAHQANLELVVSFGTESAVISHACNGRHFTDKNELSEYLQAVIVEKLKENQQIVLLAKGSRRMKMEDVIDSLKGKFLC